MSADTPPRRHARRRPSAALTLKHLAADLGISATAVSRALRGLSGVSDELRAKVRRRAAEVNYVPNLAGAALSTGSFKTFAFVLPSTPFPTLLEMEVLEGFIRAVADQGYRVNIISESFLAQSGASLADELANTLCDGALVFYLRLDEAPIDTRRLAFPMVLVNRAVEGMAADVVMTDDQGGAHLAVSHLVELGHRRIAHITGSQNNFNIMQRQLGYRQALLTHGIDYDPAIVTGSDHTREGGRKSALALFETGQQFSAIFCCDDAVALGAMDVVRARGLSVPRDISLVGFGDDVYSGMVDPPLTTVSKPRHLMGREAGRLLLDRVAGRATGTHVTVSLSTKLLVRGTAAAPAA